MSNQSWYQVARRPKWIGGLFLALAIAAIFALLGQWQLERSFTTVEPVQENEPVLNLLEVASQVSP